MTAVGSSVAGYRLEELLGQGGMGVVYRAFDDRLQRWVALKLISSGLADDVGFRERFLREARLAAAVEHPHVVPIYEAGDSDGILYLAMRMIEGPDLESLLQAGPLPVERATAIVGQVAQALSAVHARGLVHRDVTARNVLVPEVDGVEHAYLTDFGLARDAAPGATLTEEGRWAGTLDYTAPERLRGLRGDARTDVYALGCLLYRALAGRAPFPSADAAAKIAAHLTTPPPPLPPAVSAQAPHLDRVVARALAKDPDQRQPDAVTLAAELHGTVAPPPPRRSSPAAATEADAAVAAPRLAPALAAAARALHGRDDELTRLRELSEPGGRLVLVVGEPGMGKTALVARFATDRMAEGACVLHGRCFQEIRTPHGPFLEALGSDAAQALTAEPALDPDSQVHEIAGRVGAQLRGRAAGGDLILVLDDLQWADEASIRLLGQLLRRAEDVPLLVVATLRDTEPDPNLPLDALLSDLVREHRTDRISLGSLDPEAVERLAFDIAGGLLDESAKRRIHEQAGGNPFFVEELARHLASGERAETLPQSVQQVLRRRMRTLGTLVEETLETASVLGFDFEFGLLAAVSPASEAEIAESLEQALAARLVVERHPEAGRFSFAHALVLQALYEPMSTLRRARVHAAVAEALERAAGPDLDARLPEIARHYGLAGRLGDPRKAVDYAERAGHQAYARLSLEEATRHYEAALAATELAEQPPQRRCDLLLALADAQILAGEHADAVLATYERAVSIAEAAGLVDRAHRARLRAALSARPFSQHKREWATAKERARAAIPVFERLADHAGLADAWEAIGLTDFDTGTLTEAREAFDRALEHVDDDEQAERLRSWRLTTLMRGLAPVEEVEPEVDEGLAWVRHHGMRLGEAACLAFKGELLAMRDRIDEAERTWERAAAIYGDLGDDLANDRMLGHRIRHDPLAGDPARAEGPARAAVAAHQRLDRTGFLASDAPILADVLVSLGRPEEAIAWCDQALEVAQDDDYDANIRQYAARARALLGLGDVPRAVTAARRAAELAGRTEYVHLRVDALLALAEALHAAGKADEARSAADEAVALLEAKGDVAGARRARERIARLSPRPTHSHTPAPPTATIGRDTELEAAAALLTDPSTRLVTVTGPGGVGKTRLAMELARRLSGAFAHGATFVPLADMADAAYVVDAVVQALGIVAPSGEDRTEALRRSLADEELLLVLDNFEHVLAAAPLVGELVSACPHVTVLVTSRTRLRLQAELRFPIAPLPVPETEGELSGAVELFVTRARAQDPGFRLTGDNVSAVRDICVRLDGLPLAIELAAARIGLLQPTELAKRLSVALPVLESGPRDAPARHRTLEAAIDWSYQLLSADEQAAFTTLAVFAGGCTLDAAEAVTRAPLDVLLGLVEKNLVTRVGDRLRMLETVREFAVMRLRARSDVAAIRRRHARWIVEFAEREHRRLFLGEAAAVRRVDAEIDNLRAALEWSSEHDPSLLVRLLRALQAYWSNANRSLEGRDWLQAALTADITPRGLARADLLLASAILADPFGASSIPFVEEEYQAAAQGALELYEEAGQPEGIAHALITLHRGATWRDDRGSARALAERALAAAREAGDDLLVGMAWACRSLSEDRYEDVLASSLQAAEHLGRAGSRRKLAGVLNTRGYAAMLAEDHQTAEYALAEAASLAEGDGDQLTLAYIRGNEGLLRLTQGRFEDAARAFGEELTISRDGRFPKQVLIWEAFTGLACVAGARGRHEVAGRLTGAAASCGDWVTAIEVEFFAGLDRRYLDPARDHLGAAAWDHAFREGKALSRADAIAEGLREAER